MRKRRNTSWIDACASASAVEGQPDALSRDWSSQSDPKGALTSSSQVKADRALFSRLMIAIETVPVSFNTVEIGNFAPTAFSCPVEALLRALSGADWPIVTNASSAIAASRRAAAQSHKKSPSNEHDAKCAALGAVVTARIIRRATPDQSSMRKTDRARNACNDA